MTELDILYFKLCCALGLIRAPFLEVGSAKIHGEAVPNLCDLARDLNIEDVTGVDLARGSGVDFCFDFSVSQDVFQHLWSRGKFSTVCVFNVLEHTFDPITLLSNAARCVEAGGSLVVTAPAVWPLHDFPGDYLRLMPHWYEEFSRRFDLLLVREAFYWLSSVGTVKVGEFTSHGEYQLPNYRNLGRTRAPARYWVSRLAHRVFNTYGRTHFATHTAIGAAFRVPLKQADS